MVPGMSSPSQSTPRAGTPRGRMPGKAPGRATPPDGTMSRGRATRARILAAALQCFARHGLQGTTIEMIRSAANTSIGSIYHCFADREAIAAALYTECLQASRAALLEALARAKSDPAALIRACVAGHVSWATAHRAEAGFLATARRAGALAKADPDIRAGTRAFHAEVGRILHPALQAGQIRALAPEILLAQLIGPAQLWLRLWLDGQAPETPAQATQMLGDLAVAALVLPQIQTQPRSR